MGTVCWEKKLEALDFEDIYVASDAVQHRNIKMFKLCKLVDYPEMVDLVMDYDGMIVSL
jgi:tRNA 2-thiouridine synthesizing protein B